MQKSSLAPKSVLALVLLLVPLAGRAPGAEWKYLTGGNLRSVKMVGNDGWAVGDRGLVLHTSDGGTTWRIQESGTNQILRDVDFSSSRHGWAVGDGGTAIKTTNGGATWQVLPQIKPWPVFYRVCTVDSMHVWITSSEDSILRSTNGGNSFEAYQIDPRNIFFLGLDFINTREGWACGASSWIISHTTDGGITWTSRSDNRYGTGYDIDMIDSLKGGAAIDGGYVLHTEDGWNSWVMQPLGTTAIQRGISYADTLNGCCVGGTGIHVTTNGGNLWSLKVIGTTSQLYGTSHLDVLRNVVGGFSGLVARTTDQGTNWVILRTLEATGQTMFNLALADTQSGYAVGPYGIVVKTTNGGTIWQRQNLGGTSLWFYGVDAPDPNYAWTCGDGGSIYATKDGGANWAYQNSGVSWFLNSVDMVDTLFGVSVGGGYGPIAECGLRIADWKTNGEIASSPRFTSRTPRNDTIIKPCETPPLVDKWWWIKEGQSNPEAQYRVITRTFDGTNWQGRTTSETPLNGVSFANKALGWACGVSGTMIHTSDSGTTWQAQNSNVTNTLYWVIFSSATNGWAVGTGGTIIATTDGGNTWNRQTSNTTIDLYSAAFVNSQRGWVVGDSGLALQTTNGGQTWAFDTTRTKIPLYAASFTDQDHGWSIGGFGLTLGYGRAGQWGVETTPEVRGQRLEVRLKAQPNPFVSYARVPGREKERFALYDVTGRRVGTYKGDRIGLDASAGVYFLMAENIGSAPVRVVKIR